MPEIDQDVIFYVKDRDTIFCGRYAGEIERSGKLQHVFEENLDSWWFEDEEITHWMPLPNPPER